MKIQILKSEQNIADDDDSEKGGGERERERERGCKLEDCSLSL